MGPQSQGNTRKRKSHSGSERNAGREHPNHRKIPATRPEKMVDRRGFQKKETKDGKTERTRWKALSRIRTGYTRVTHHGPKMEGIGNPLCPFCNTDLSVDHTVGMQRNWGPENEHGLDMNKEQWINGKKDMEKMIDYATEIGLYNGTKNKKKQTKKKQP
jgi:hypothetical protein